MTERTRTARDLTLRMLELINRGDFGNLGEVYSEDAVTDWPQTGERVRGIANAEQIYRNYPGGQGAVATDEVRMFGDDDSYVLTPMFTMVRSEGQGDHAVVTVRTRYPDGSDWYVISIAEARGGRMIHITQFFAPVIEAPEWRAQWVEPIPRAESTPQSQQPSSSG